MLLSPHLDGRIRGICCRLHDFQRKGPLSLVSDSNSCVWKLSYDISHPLWKLIQEGREVTQLPTASKRESLSRQELEEFVIEMDMLEDTSHISLFKPRTSKPTPLVSLDEVSVKTIITKITSAPVRRKTKIHYSPERRKLEVM